MNNFLNFVLVNLKCHSKKALSIEILTNFGPHFPCHKRCFSLSLLDSLGNHRLRSLRPARRERSNCVLPALHSLMKCLPPLLSQGLNPLLAVTQLVHEILNIALASSFPFEIQCSLTQVSDLSQMCTDFTD